MVQSRTALRLPTYQQWARSDKSTRGYCLRTLVFTPHRAARVDATEGADR